MPNIKSAKKRVKVTAKKSANNKDAKTNLKTYIKKFYAAADTGDKEASAAAYSEACSKVDKAVDKGILHVNTASRRKKTMAAKLAEVNK